MLSGREGGGGRGKGRAIGGKSGQSACPVVRQPLDTWTGLELLDRQGSLGPLEQGSAGMQAILGQAATLELGSAGMQAILGQAATLELGGSP